MKNNTGSTIEYWRQESPGGIIWLCIIKDGYEIKYYNQESGMWQGKTDDPTIEATPWREYMKTNNDLKCSKFKKLTREEFFLEIL